MGESWAGPVLHELLHLVAGSLHMERDQGLSYQ